MKRIFAFFALAWASIGFMLNSQPLAVKTNLLGWATTTMNLGAEIAVAHRHTVQLFGALNPWTFPADAASVSGRHSLSGVIGCAKGLTVIFSVSTP